MMISQLVVHTESSVKTSQFTITLDQHSILESLITVQAYLVALLVIGILQMPNDGLTLLKGRGAWLPNQHWVCTSYQGHMQRGHTHTTLHIRLVCAEWGRGAGVQHIALLHCWLLKNNGGYLFCCSSTFCSMTLIRRAFLFFSEARAFLKSRTSSSSKNTRSSSAKAGMGQRRENFNRDCRIIHTEISPPFGVPGSVSSPWIVDCNLPLLLLPLAVETATSDYSSTSEYAQCQDNQHSMQLQS